MPIYEYYSPDTNKIYSFFAKSSRFKDIIPACPDGSAHKMQKIVSNFAFIGSTDKAENQNAPGGGDLDDPKMMQAMAEMEKAISGMDEDNPDPKQMGQLMRKMAEMTGEKMDSGMEEMIAKLEEGKDPEELEAEMGDLLGDDSAGGMDPMGMGGEPEMNAEDSDAATTAAGRLKQLLKNQKKNNAPQKDPELYEYSDEDIAQLEVTS